MLVKCLMWLDFSIGTVACLLSIMYSHLKTTDHDTYRTLVGVAGTTTVLGCYLLPRRYRWGVHWAVLFGLYVGFTSLGSQGVSLSLW